MRRWIPTVAATSLLLLTGCTILPAEEVEQPVALVIPPEPERALFPVKRGTIQEQVRAMGRVASQQEAVLYFRDGGRVLQVNVKAGDRVRAGQVLALLETGDLSTRLQLAELSLRQARLRVEEAGKGPRVDGVNYDLAYAEIELERQQVLHAQLLRQMEGATLTAPFDGQITSLALKPGDQVQGLTPVVAMADPASLEVRMEVATDETLAKLGLGRRAELKITSGTAELQAAGTIVQMPDPTLAPAPGQSDRQIRIAFEEKVPEGVKLGDLAQVTITIREAKDALIIPNAAIRSYAGRVYVNLLQGDVKREVDIQLGIQAETESEVLKGLSEGQQVIGK